jgi:3-oxoacyl-[acyl-carrier protein] reductase
VVKSIESAAGKARAFRADAADPKAIQDAVKMTVETFGQLDILRACQDPSFWEIPNRKVD